MIQRIQTIYLLLTTITAILFLSGNIFLFENGTEIGLSGINADMQNNALNLVLSILFLTIPLLSFLNIFFYKKRKLQIRLTMFLLFLIIFLIGVAGYYVFKISIDSDTSIVFNYKLILPVLMLIFTFMAYRGIRKDEEIVRSYDRLR